MSETENIRDKARFSANPFKVGDKVRFIDNSLLSSRVGYGLKLGDVYTVSSVREATITIQETTAGFELFHARFELAVPDDTTGAASLTKTEEYLSDQAKLLARVSAEGDISNYYAAYGFLSEFLLGLDKQLD